MSNELNDGGAAFPLAPVGTGDPRDGMAGGSVGMSLRDWFAGMALSQMVQSHSDSDVKHAENCAKDCYAFADAMIGAR